MAFNSLNKLTYMKFKLLTSLLLVVLLNTTSFAQNFEKGDKALGFGIGFGTNYYGSQAIPPISVSFDLGIHEKISVGAIFGFGTNTYSYSSLYKWRYTHILFGARGNYHWGKHISALPEKLDLYAGAFLGFDVVKVDYDGYTGIDGEDYGGLILGGQVGARWYFSDKFAAFVEGGVGLSAARLGVTLRL